MKLSCMKQAAFLNIFIKKRCRAFALISVLVLISMLSVLALEFSQRSTINLKMSINHAQYKKALYTAYGGYEAALALLMGDRNEYDGPGDRWYSSLPPFPMEQGSVQVIIADEKARFNITDLVTAYGVAHTRRKVMLERMFEMLALDTSLIGGLIDWQDQDDIRIPGGAEGSYYSFLSPAYSPPNRPVMTAGEVLLIRGLDREVYFLPPSSRTHAGSETESLKDYITVYGDGRININTAGLPVLMSLSRDMDRFIAEDIIEYRLQHPFKKPGQLKEVETVSDALYDEISSLITVKSNIFRITSMGSSTGFSRRVEAVVYRQSRGFRVVYFHRSD
ncbi:MAG: type II secretion system minor pseudopilin GspK [Spirochaetota bacterium]